MRALLLNQSLNPRVVFLCHDEAECIDYVTVFHLICVPHRGVEINTTFDPENGVLFSEPGIWVFITRRSPLALSCWRHNGVMDGLILYNVTSILFTSLQCWPNIERALGQVFVVDWMILMLISNLRNGGIFRLKKRKYWGFIFKILWRERNNLFIHRCIYLFIIIYDCAFLWLYNNRRPALMAHSLQL